MSDIVSLFGLDDFGIIKGGTESDDMRCYGFASTPAKDWDEEQVMQKGLEITPLVQRGWVDWDHDRSEIIGWVTNGDFRKHPETLVKGLYTEFNLNPEDAFARKQYNKMKSLEKAGCPRNFGLSLEGTRGVKKGRKVMTAVAYGLALTPYPKNPETTAHVFMKSLMGVETLSDLDASGERLFESDLVDRIVANVVKALETGHDVGGTSQSDGAALRKETMGKAYTKFSVKYWPKDISIYPEDEQGIMKAIKEKADKNNGYITKADAAILTHLVKGFPIVAILRALDFTL